MSENVLYFLLFLFFALEINASTTVLPSSTVQSSGQSATPSATPSATFSPAPTPCLYYVSTTSSSVTPAVRPYSSSFPMTSSVSQGTTPTQQSKTSRIGKPVILVLGFVLAFVALLTAFVIYYFVAGTRNRITGITDEAFVEDSDRGPDGSTKVADPDGPPDGSTNAAASDGPPDGSTKVADPDGPTDGLTKVAAPDRSPEGSTYVAAPDPEVKVTAENDDFAYEVTSF